VVIPEASLGASAQCSLHWWTHTVCCAAGDCASRIWAHSSAFRRVTMILALVAIVVLLVVFVIGMYNGLVRLKVQCDNAWSDIDVQLKRRYDLIPNLVETVKGYAAHEKGTLEAVVAARNQAMNTQGPAAKAEAEGVLTSALRQVFALAEAYPQLRAVESFTQLQQSLSQIEDSVQNARRYYNAVVRDLNTKIVQFPSNIIAGMFNITPRQFFEISAPAERDVPKVSFGATT
jgi:LemA protein